MIRAVLVIALALLAGAAPAAAVIPEGSSVDYGFHRYVLLTGVSAIPDERNASLEYFDDPDVQLYVPAENITTAVLASGRHCTYGRAVNASVNACRKSIKDQKRWQQWEQAHGTVSTFASLLSSAIYEAAAEPVSFHSDHSERRRLAIGDFQALNNVLNGVSFRIPDSTFTQSGIDITIKNLVCGGVSLGDMSLVGAAASNTLVNVDLSITQLAVSCSCDWRWDWGWFGGSGTASAGGSRNNMNTRVAFRSADLRTKPPTSGSVSSCGASIDLTRLSFSGGITAAIANLFKGIVRGFIEDKVGEVACSELSGVGAELVTELLKTADAYIEPYRGPKVVPDPLLGERTLAADGTTGDLMKVYAPTSAPNLPTKLISEALHMLDDHLGSNYESGGRSDLGINHMVRSALGATGELELNATAFGKIYSGTDPITTTSVTVTKIKLKGLDSFTSFNALTVLGGQTLQHSLAMEHLDVEMTVRMEIGPSTAEDSMIQGHSNVQIVEEVTLTSGLRQLRTSIATLLAVRANDFRRMKIGSLIRAPAACTVSTIHALNFTSLDLRVGDMVAPRMSGFISPGLDRLFAGVSDAAFLMYEEAFLSVMPNFGQAQRASLNSGLKHMMQSTQGEGSCPAPTNPATAPPQWFDFQNSSLFNTVTNLLDTNLAVDSDAPGAEIIAPNDERFRINRDLIGPATKNQSGEAGVLLAPGDLFSTKQDGGNGIGVINLRVSDLRVAGLDTVYNLTLLKAISAHELYNRLSLGAPRDLNVSVDVALEITGGGVLEMRNHVRVSLSLAQLDVVLTLLVKLDVTEIMFLELQHATNIDCIMGALAPIGGLGITQLTTTVGRLAFDVVCISCSSPKILELGDRLRSPESTQEITDGVNSMLMRWSSIVTSAETAEMIDSEIEAARSRCMAARSISVMGIVAEQDLAESTPSAAVDEAPIEVTMLASMVLLGMAVLAICTCCFVCVSRQRRLLAYQKELDTSRSSGELGDGETKSPLITETTSLWRSDTIPLFVRVAVPVVLVINILFFLSGHLSLGATIDLYVTVAGDNAQIADFFTFSLGQSTIDMWNAGAKGLAILIVLFSGLWPYTKIFITIFMWFAPPTVLAPASRGSLFLWLDALGKWSMIDIFVLVMSMVAFHLRIFSPEATSIPVDLYFIEVLVEPVWGLYANMIAQLISQLVSHVAIYYHRNVVSAAENSTGGTLIGGSKIPRQPSPKTRSGGAVAMAIDRLERGVAQTSSSQPRRRASTWMSSTSVVTGPRVALIDTRDKLYSHVYSISGSKRRIRFGCTVNVFIVMLAISAFCALAYGSMKPSFRVEIHGLAGLALELGRTGSSVQTYSIIGVFNEILSQAQPALLSQLGINYIALIFLICAMAAPFAQVLALLTLWCAPLKLKQLKLMLVVNEVVAAWQYLEVYLIAIVVSLLQIGQISGFMVGDICDGVEPTLQGLARMSLIDTKHATCFYVHADIEAGTYWLLAASIALNFMAQFVTRAAASAARDREIRIKGFEPEIDISNRRFCFESICLSCCSLLCCVHDVVDESGNITPIEHRRRTSSVYQRWDGYNPVRLQDQLQLRQQRPHQQQYQAEGGGRSAAVGSPRNTTPVRNPLPIHWQAVQAPDGATFYWNRITGQTQWERPEAPVPLTVRVPPPRPPRTASSRNSSAQGAAAAATHDLQLQRARAASSNFKKKLAKFRRLESLNEQAE